MYYCQINIYKYLLFKTKKTFMKKRYFQEHFTYSGYNINSYRILIIKIKRFRQKSLKNINFGQKIFCGKITKSDLHVSTTVILSSHGK